MPTTFLMGKRAQYETKLKGNRKAMWWSCHHKGYVPWGNGKKLTASQLQKMMDMYGLTKVSYGQTEVSPTCPCKAAYAEKHSLC